MGLFTRRNSIIQMNFLDQISEVEEYKMENVKTEKKYVEPKLEVIHFSETDIITTSGDGRDDEGEIIIF